MVRAKPAFRRDDPPPEDFSEPGYYKVREDERDDYFRWFDGKEWVGPEVSPIWVALYTVLVQRGADPANLRMLTWVIGSVVLFLIVLILLGVLFNLFGGGDEEESDPSASAGAVATTIGETGAATTAPPTTTTTAVTSTVASSATAATTQAAVAIDTSDRTSGCSDFIADGPHQSFLVGDTSGQHQSWVPRQQVLEADLQIKRLLFKSDNLTIWF